MRQPSFSLLAFSQRIRSGFLILLTLAYLLGQACTAQGWFVPAPVWLGVSIIATGGAWRFVSRGLAVSVACLLLTFFTANVALRRVLDPHLPANHLRRLALPQEVTIEGMLLREPERFTHRGRLSVEALSVWRDGAFRPATGRILLNVRSLTGPWRYGDVLRMTIRLRSPRNFSTPGSFDYERYLARQEVYLTAFLWDDARLERVGWQGNALRSGLERLRREIGKFFSDRLQEQTAAVLRALIIGDEGGLTKDTRTVFSRAGVAHVLSISGLHISFVAMASYGAWWWLLGRSRYVLLRFVMPKMAALLTIPPVLFYAGLAGGNIATWRSVLMVVVYLLAVLLGRQEEVYRSLALAALLISVLWPGAVLDISFQLSFLSVLSIVLGMRQFTAWRERRSTLHPALRQSWNERLPYWLAASFVVSLCALLGTAPLTAFHFNQVAVVGVLANLLVIPLLGSGAVLLGLLAATTLFLHSGLAALILFCAGFVTQIGVWLTQTIGAWSWAAFSVVTPTLLELFLFYGCLGCLFCLCFSIHVHVVAACKYAFPVFVVALLLDGLFWLHARYLHQDLRVTFLDVGQGDAAVIELPGSQVMVIDGGGFASEEFDAGEAILAPFLWSRKIGQVDILVMSHPQLDHYGGLGFLTEHFSPRELWFSGEQSSAARFVRLWTALQRNRVVLKELCRDTPVLSFSSVQVQVLHPPCQHSGLDTNNASLVLRLSHGDVDLLFPGDLEAEGEQELLAHNGSVRSEILKAPHHGSRTSSTAVFLDAVAPQIVVASLGNHNRFKFPAEEIVQRYEQRHCRFFRTDLDGAISVVSDGKTYRIAVSQNRSLTP
jgi:competence protein ComEC